MSRKMGMMKRVASILIALALLVGLFPTSVYATEDGTSNISVQEGVVGETQNGNGDAALNESMAVTGGNESGDDISQIENEEEEPTDEEITPEEEVTETWTDVLPLREVMVQTYDEIDNLSLFQSYVEQLLQGERGFDSSMQLWSEPEGEKLSGVSRKAYELLRKQLEEIANGSETKTTINLSVQELGIYGGWSLEALELENFDDEEAVIDALVEKLWMELDYNAVLTSLRVDLSMAMYWFDPNVGVSIHLQGGIRTTGDGQDARILGVQFRFAVEETFQGEEGGYTTNPSWILNAEAALAKLNGNTLNQVNLANAAGTLNGEDEILTQAETWGEVDGILVERNYLSTEETTKFQGGYISKAKAEAQGVTEAEFLAAYVERLGVRYPIIFLGTNASGEIRYLLDTPKNATSPADEVVTGTVLLQESEKIIFSYKSLRTSYSVTYKMKNNALNDKFWTETYYNGSQLNQGGELIEPGQVIYIQILRIPGTDLSIHADNAYITLVSDGNSTSGANTFLQIYRLHSAWGDVTVEWENTWRKTSYNVTVTARSAEYTAGGMGTGSLSIDCYGKVNELVQSVENEVEDSASSTEVSVTVRSDLESWFSLNHSPYNPVLTFGVDNTIYDVKSGHFQVLNAITIGGERFAFSEWYRDYGSTPILQKRIDRGEAYGTIVSLYKGNNTIVWGERYHYYYTMQIECLHTDLSIQLEYTTVETNQGVVYEIKNLDGVEVQLYKRKEDGTIGWVTVSEGERYYVKDAVIPGSSVSASAYTVRCKNRNAELTIYISDESKHPYDIHNFIPEGVTSYGEVPPTPERVEIGSDGYWTVDCNKLKNIEPNSIVLLDFQQFNHYYQVKYDTGSTEATYITEPKVFLQNNIILRDQYLISTSRPIWNNKHLFKGYKIKNDLTGKIYQPGDVIDLSAVNRYLSYEADENGYYEVLTLVAQWEDIIDTDTILADMTIKLRKSNGRYENRAQTVATSQNTEYMPKSIDTTLATDEGFPLTYKKSERVGTDNLVLYYEHPATVYYTAGIDVPSSEVTGDLSSVSTYSFEEEEIRMSRLTRKGYTHIGWVDVSTGTQYLFNGTTTQSLDDESGIAVLTDILEASEWISSPQGIVENRVATQADMKFEVPWDGATLAAVWVEGEEALEAKDITITTEQAAKLTNEWLIQETGARVYDPLTGTTLRYPTVTENTVQTTPGVYSVTFSSGDSGLTKTISVTVKAVATTTIDQFGTNPFGQTILFVATKPGESVQSALKSAGVTLGVDVQGTGKNFVIIGPNNSGFLISGATGVGYILPNKEGTGYTLPGAGSNFTIIGNHEAGYQLIDPNGQVYDVIGDIDQGYYLLSQDKKLYILRGNSITGFYLVLLSDIDTENDAEDATKQSPLTTGRTRSVYPFGVAGGLLLSLYCVMQWNPPRKKKRV